MKPRISETDFAVLVSRTGLPLTPDQSSDIYAIYGLIEAMRDRVHAPLPREAEPSTVFRPQAGG